MGHLPIDSGRGPNRRSFLKASGLAAASTILGRETAAAAQASELSRKEDHADSAQGRPVAAVNLLQGTDSEFEFSHGNTLPIAALPFGMGHWTLQSHADTPWMFQPSARRIQGLRCTRQLSPWLDDYGSVTFLPFCGEISAEPLNRSSSYDPETAHLAPHSLELYLLRYRAKVELVPTERCAVVRSSWENDAASPGMLFELPSDGCEFHSGTDGSSITFKTSANAGGLPDNFSAYYHVTFSAPHRGMEIKDVGRRKVAIVRFGGSRMIEARIGTSFISYAQAARNCERELGNKPLEALREEAANQWNQHLGRIEVSGGTADQRRTFYSCLYRTLIYPRMWHEIDGDGNAYHFSAFNGKVMPGVMYADHGYWDLYRAWYPMMSILFPEKLGEILQAWVNAYTEGGWLPQFPAPGYRSCMTGSFIDAVFADAAMKGISGFNLRDAYAGMKKHATQPGNPEKGYGRTGLEYYLRSGYIPADRIQQSVAETADAAYADFCISQVAATLHEGDDQRIFLDRSKNWRNLFDPEVKFLRGKNEDGSWLGPFDPFAWGSPYVEGSAWQHRWDAPHDLPWLIEAMGGQDAAADALTQMLRLPAKFDVGVYGMEIHEMSEMASASFGQYAHSNEPVHHHLYIFSHVNRPDLTQYWVRRVMTELYSPDSFPGDEDTGAMSAWFILSALGFYPLCPGRTEYTLGSPLFSEAVVHLPGEKTLRIQAPGNSPKTVFVRSASLNGNPLTSHTVEHATLMKGGTLHFAVAAE